MAEFFVGFILGFIAASAVTVWWYHGNLKPKIDGLKKEAAEALRQKLGG